MVNKQINIQCRIEHKFWKYVLNFNSSSLDRKLHFQHTDTVLGTKKKVDKFKIVLIKFTNRFVEETEHEELFFKALTQGKVK